VQIIGDRQRTSHPHCPHRAAGCAQGRRTGALLRKGDKAIGQRPSLPSADRAHIDKIPSEEGAAMQAIAVRDRDAGDGGLSLTEMPYPHAARE
jgi:hypothetical protein